MKQQDCGQVGILDFNTHEVASGVAFRGVVASGFFPGAGSPWECKGHAHGSASGVEPALPLGCVVSKQ